MDNQSQYAMSITPSFPFELHYLKALYLNHQYKECARRCEELLDHNQDEPAHVIFLNFYAALSHEGLARIMHVFSVWRLPKIIAAESAYYRALQACTAEERLLEEKTTLSVPGFALDQSVPRPTVAEKSDARKRKSKPSLAHLGPELESIHTKSNKRVERVNFSWPRSFTPLSCETVKAIQYSVCQDMVAPLEDPFTVSSPEPSSGATSAQDTPIKRDNLSANRKGAFDSPHPPSPTPSYRSIQPPVSSAQTAYANHITAIYTQITSHLDHLLDLKQSTTTEQAERVRRQSGSMLSEHSTKPKLPQSRSIWSFKDPEAEKKERVTRVEEGRAKGWRTERFEPKRYIELAEEALAELES
ncbi:hypothetical protein E4T43_07919 [Aureobasidium subglaciale]|nr:hypothetical protein E4T43_07919 [Aureobasidium subglaciale]